MSCFTMCGIPATPLNPRSTPSGALERKDPNAPQEFHWQRVFPQGKRWRNSTTHEQGQHHVDLWAVQRAVHRAVLEAGLTSRASCHVFRHSFATHVIEAGYDIRTVQELLVHRYRKTTMRDTHVLNRGPAGVHCPIDGL